PFDAVVCVDVRVKDDEHRASVRFNAAEIDDRTLHVQAFAVWSTSLPDCASPVPNARDRNRNESWLSRFKVGEPPRCEGLLLTLNHHHWNPWICELLQGDARRHIEAVASTWRSEVFAVLLDGTILPSNKIGMVTADTVTNRGDIVWPIVWDQHAGAVSLALLAHNFPAFLLIDPAKHGCVGDLLRDPGVYEVGVVRFDQGAAPTRRDEIENWSCRRHSVPTLRSPAVRPHPSNGSTVIWRASATAREMARDADRSSASPVRPAICTLTDTGPVPLALISYSSGEAASRSRAASDNRSVG